MPCYFLEENFCFWEIETAPSLK